MYKFLLYCDNFLFKNKTRFSVNKKPEQSPGFVYVVNNNYLPNKPPRSPPRPPLCPCCWLPPPKTLPKRSVIGFPEEACASLVAFP